MKQILAIALALVMVAAFTVPALAVTTQIEIVGNGVPPIVKAKWETPDADPATPGTQVMPIAGSTSSTAPCTVMNDVTVFYHAIVASRLPVDVYADVFHPEVQKQENINGNIVPGEWCGSFKYQVTLLNAGLSNDQEVAAFMDAYNADLVTLNWGYWNQSGYDCDMDGDIDEADFICDIVEEINQGEATLYTGFAPISNHQPAGCYTVNVQAKNETAWSDTVSNCLTVLELKSFILDFSSVNYGKVQEHQHIWAVSGDANMCTPAKPTVWNNGNVYEQLRISQNDAGFGKRLVNGQYVWNVHWDARLGSESTAVGVATYDPNQPPTVIPGILVMCTPTKLDFSILVDKAPNGAGSYTGTMTIDSVLVPFQSCTGGGES
jgi:hypothetical protein